MPKMMVAQVTKPGAPFELVEQDIPQPGPGQVRIRVMACGICHSDVFTKENIFPGIRFPRVPGHEVAGVIDEVGTSVTAWDKGQRVGVGWHGGHCGHCTDCRRGDFINCAHLQVTGIHFNGGYEEYMVAPVNALAALPGGISFEEAAPLLCAGITTYNSLRHSGAQPGDLVAIEGLGGLGHLAVQFANRFGFRVAAISRGHENAELASKLGAHHYLDSRTTNIAEKLQKIGGARVILATAPSGKSKSALVDGLATNGKMVVVGASPESIEVSPVQLIHGRRSIQGWPAGTAADSEDTLRFAVLSGIRPMIETFPLSRANEAYDRMMSGKARFRAVLTMKE